MGGSGIGGGLRGHAPLRTCVGWGVVLVGLAVVALGPAPASAQPPTVQEVAPGRDEEAYMLFRAGTVAYENGRYEEALERFDEAYELSHRPELLYNVGLAHDRLRHDAEALAAFDAFLAQAPADAPRRPEVERRVEVLRQTLAEREALEARAREADAAEARDAERPRTPIYKKWWFWTVIGVGVTAAVVVPIVVTHDAGTTASTPSDLGGPFVVRWGGLR